MVKKVERYMGSLVGLLCGDVLGAPYETWDAERIAADIDERNGLMAFEYVDPWHGKLWLPAGRPTDDSDQAACLALSLVHIGEPDPADLYFRLQQTVYEYKSPLWSGMALGAGRTTKKALSYKTYEVSQQRVQNGEFPSNGALMRVAPLGLYFGKPDKVNKDVVATMSEVTHRHPFSTAVCTAYVTILAALLSGASREKAIECGLAATKDSDVRAACRRPDTEPRDPAQWPGRGAALFTFEVALWTLVTTESFAEGIEAAIKIGGDTDTYAAVAGALLGAYYGVEAIPGEWQSVLLGREVMETCARNLMHLSEVL